MSLYIQQEARLAGISFVLGLVLMGSYDLLRLFRFFVPHSDLWRGLEDLGLCNHDLFPFILCKQRYPKRLCDHQHLFRYVSL